MTFPFNSYHKEEHNQHQPEHTEGSIRTKLCKIINNKYLSPTIMKLSIFPINHKNLNIKFIIFLN
jgi:hypothetical protein